MKFIPIAFDFIRYMKYLSVRPVACQVRPAILQYGMTYANGNGNIEVYNSRGNSCVNCFIMQKYH